MKKPEKQENPQDNRTLKQTENPYLEGIQTPEADTDAVDPAIHRRQIRDRRREIKDYRRLERARDILADFEPGVEIFGFTKGQFSLIQLIEAVLEKTGPARLFISTWTAAHTDITDVLRFVESGRLIDTRWLVDFSFQRRAPALANRLRQLFGHESVRVARNHAKFALIENNQWQIVIRTSMNLNTNPRFEDFTLAHDPDLAAFLGNIMAQLWKKQRKDLAFATPQDIKNHFARDL